MPRSLGERGSGGTIIAVQLDRSGYESGQVYLRHKSGERGAPYLKVGKTHANVGNPMHDFELEVRHELERMELAGRGTREGLEKITATLETQLELEQLFWSRREFKISVYPEVETLDPGPSRFPAIVLAGTGLSGKTTLIREGVLGLPARTTLIRTRGPWMPSSLADVASTRSWLARGGIAVTPRNRTGFDATQLASGWVVGQLDSIVDTDKAYLIRHTTAEAPLLTEVNVRMSHLTFSDLLPVRDMIVPVLMPRLTEDELRARWHDRSPARASNPDGQDYARKCWRSQELEYARILQTYPNTRQLQTADVDELRRVIQAVIRG